MSRPKVSVIVPVYNAEKYLSACLMSLTAQSLQDMEIIICDNASKDGSLNIIQQFYRMYGNIKLIMHAKNKGQAQNMIDGLNAAEGEYIAECDADDFAFTPMYQRLYEYAFAHDCDAVKCGWIDFTDEGFRKRQFAKYDTTFGYRDMDHKTLSFFLGYQPHVMSGIYKREWIIENNLWYQPDGSFQDTSMMFKIKTLAKRFGMIPDCLYGYRRDNMQSGTYTDLNLFGVNEQYRIIEAWNEDRELNLEDIIEMTKYYTYRWQLNRLKNLDARKKFYETSAREFDPSRTREGMFLNKNDFADYKSWAISPVSKENG